MRPATAIARLCYRLAPCAAAGLLLAGLTACSSASRTPSSTGSQAEALRLGDAPALLWQCLLDRGFVQPSSSIFAGQSVWLHGRNIVLTYRTASDFTAWFGGQDGTVVGGHDLNWWTQWAADHDKLPAAVCGASVSASALQKRVFKYPQAGQPWGT